LGFTTVANGCAWPGNDRSKMQTAPHTVERRRLCRFAGIRW
jgi:hypothetical protein